MARRSQSVSDKLMMTITVRTSSNPNRHRRRHPVRVRINRGPLSSGVRSASCPRLSPAALRVTELRPSQSLAASEPRTPSRALAKDDMTRRSSRWWGEIVDNSWTCNISQNEIRLVKSRSFIHSSVQWIERPSKTSERLYRNYAMICTNFKSFNVLTRTLTAVK